MCQALYISHSLLLDNFFIAFCVHRATLTLKGIYWNDVITFCLMYGLRLPKVKYNGGFFANNFNHLCIRKTRHAVLNNGAIENGRGCCRVVTFFTYFFYGLYIIVSNLYLYKFSY